MRKIIPKLSLLHFLSGALDDSEIDYCQACLGSGTHDCLLGVEVSASLLSVSSALCLQPYLDFNRPRTLKLHHFMPHKNSDLLRQKVTVTCIHEKVPHN